MTIETSGKTIQLQFIAEFLRHMFYILSTLHILSIWKDVSESLLLHYLRLPDKNAVILLAGEVSLALDRAVVLALGFVQDDAHPLSRGEERGSDVGHRAALPFANHLHQGAHFDGPPASIWAHPAAATAGGLSGTRKK